MKRFLIVVFLAPFSFAYAGHLKKRQVPEGNWLNFSSYVRENYRILSKRKRDPHMDQVAFQEDTNRVPAADVPNPAPLKDSGSFNNSGSSGFGGSYGGTGYGGTPPPPSGSFMPPSSPSPMPASSSPSQPPSSPPPMPAGGR